VDITTVKWLCSWPVHLTGTFHSEVQTKTLCLPCKTPNFRRSERWIHTKMSTPSTPMHCTLNFMARGGGGSIGRYYRPADGFTREKDSCRKWRGSLVGQRAGFHVLEKWKISFLAGKRPRHQSSAIHSTRLHFASRRSAAALFIQVFQTLVQLRRIRSYYSSDEWSRYLVELQKGTATLHQQVARPLRLQPIRRIQPRTLALFGWPRSSYFSCFDYHAV
jgi:hypothetical protein